MDQIFYFVVLLVETAFWSLCAWGLMVVTICFRYAKDRNRTLWLVLSPGICGAMYMGFKATLGSGKPLVYTTLGVVLWVFTIYLVKPVPYKKC